MTRRLLFHRDFRRYSGGHGKVWDYYAHARAHPDWEATVHLVPGSVDTDNPWRAGGVPVAPRWDPSSADALFLGGMDWIAWPEDDPRRPVINLVQAVRHADPSHPLHAFLSRRAVRICVSQPVADAILATGRVNGPVRVIEAAVSLPATRGPSAGAAVDVFIGALKRRQLGHALASALRAAGLSVDIADAWLPRDAYLARLASARVAVLLPLPAEGFYLPALEAMALGRAVVVPDCVGNRAYLDPGRNALVPADTVEALLEATLAACEPARRAALAEGATATAARFSPQRERAAFHGVLDALDALWRA